MKDIVIKGKYIRREIVIALACFGAAFFLNVTAVFLYDRPLIEIFSQIGYVVVIAVCIYGLLAVIRGVIALSVYMFKRDNH